MHMVNTTFCSNQPSEMDSEGYVHGIVLGSK